jgi:hypothetical protein
MWFLESPLTALSVALLLGGLAASGKFNVIAARILFCAAWIAGVLSIRDFPALLFLFGSVFWTAFIILLILWARPEVVPLYWGQLIPRRRLLFSRARAANPQFEIGDTGAIFVYAGPAGTPALLFSPDDYLTVEIINGKVKVSTIIRDEQGHLVAEILRNFWKVSPSRTWDINYNRDALEVRNAKGDIVLQVRVLNDRIQLQGEWHPDGVNGVRLVKSDDPAHPGGAVIVGRLEDAPKIPAMFKYPSNEYFGQLNRWKPKRG